MSLVGIHASAPTVPSRTTWGPGRWQCTFVGLVENPALFPRSISPCSCPHPSQVPGGVLSHVNDPASRMGS